MPSRPRKMRQPIAARQPARARVAVGLEKNRKRLLGVADQEGVEEVGDRLGVRRARPAAEDDRVGLTAVALPDRQTREIQHVQDVRVVQLRLEREAEDVEVGHGRERLGREERQRRLAHLRLEVHPRRVHALAGKVGAAIHDLVQDLQTGMAHPDLVRVGEREGERHGSLRQVLAGDVALEADVPARLLDRGQEGIEPRAEGRVAHRNRGFYRQSPSSPGGRREATATAARTS